MSFDIESGDNMGWEELLKTPARDVRYKVTQEDIDRMRELRESGLSQQAISNLFAEEGKNISRNIIQYWTNEESRKKQRAKNAKRRYDPDSEENKRRIQRDMEKRRKNFAADSEMETRHRIQRALDEKRFPRHSVKVNPESHRRMDIDNARRLLESGKLQRKNRKMRD